MDVTPRTNSAAGQTAELAAFAVRVQFESLPADVVEKAKLCFRDGLGCCLYGVTQ